MPVKKYLGSGFLPSVYQGTLPIKGDPVLYLKDPKGVSRGLKKILESINEINFKEYQNFGDPEF